MVQAALPEAARRQDDLVLAEPPKDSAAFQQELRSHLRTIEHKLDRLSQRLEGLGSEGPFCSAGDAAAPLDRAPEDDLHLQSASTQLPTEDSPATAGGHELQATAEGIPPVTGSRSLDFKLPNSTVGISFAHVEDQVLRDCASLKAGANSPPDLNVSSHARSGEPANGADATALVDEPPLGEAPTQGDVESAPERAKRPRASGTRRQLTRLFTSSSVGRISSLLQLQDAGKQRDKGLDRLAGLRRVVSHDKLTQRQYLARKRNLWQFVNGAYFQCLSCLMIILNVFLIGIIANARLKARLAQRQESPVWEFVEIGFIVFFAVELLLRFFADKFLSVFGLDWRWNLFDLCLVLFSMVDLILNRITSLAFSNVEVARILRFVRFIRLVRIARAVRAFHSLRVVVFAILESFFSLIWCFIVVVLIIYMFAILILYGITEHIAEGQADETAKKELLRYFGSVPTACYSLFMTISGGVDWQDVMLPLKGIHWTYQPLFTFYVFLMVIGVLNVVMGAFVAATADIANKDRDVLVRHEIHQLKAYTRRIKEFFTEADTNRSGTLSWDEFREHLKVPQVAAYFQALELDVSQAHVLFRLLDRDGNLEVSLDEFLAGCLRLKGAAKSLEVQLLLYENKLLFAKLSDFMEVLVKHLPVSVDISAAVAEKAHRRGAAFSE